jgi:hypothetical protein
MNEFPRVLVAAPTASVKKYCFDEWLENILDFTYPNFNVLLFDNTNDDGEFASYMNDLYKSRYGYSDKFLATNSLVINNSLATNVIEKMCLSHNDCREYALFHNYDYLLHLESDIFPEKDIIQNLMFHKKDVVGSIYYRDEGLYRKPMLQMSFEPIKGHIKSLNFETNEDLTFLNGQLKRVAHVGLGCILLSKKVLKKIQFRFEKNVDMHPDTFFAEDCFRKGFSIFAETSSICRHENQAWGIYGVDYK